MRFNRYISAFACALTIGLATGGHAQRATMDRPIRSNAPSARAFPSTSLQVLEEALQGVTPVHLSGSNARAVRYVNNGKSHPFAITNSAFYMAIPAPGNVFYDSGDKLNSVLDDIYLPVGITKTSGVMLTGLKLAVVNGDPATVTTPSEIHGVITIYDKLDTTQTANIAVTPLASYAFDFTGADALPQGFYTTVTLTPTTPITLTHDTGTTGGFRYAVTLATFDDAAHTIYSQHIFAGFTYGNGTSTLPQVGYSADVFWSDDAKTNTFPNSPVFFNGPPFVSNLALELDGTSPDDLTYNVSGTFIYPALPHGAPAQPVKLSFQSTTNPTAAPKVINTTQTLADHKNASGVVDGQQSSFTYFATGAGGLPADTYTLTITSPKFAPITQTVVLPATEVDSTTTPAYTTVGNLHTLNETFTPTTTTATGNIALEGVPDLSATSFNALPGTFTIGFYTPGSVTPGTPATPVYSATVSLKTTPGSANGSYSVSGIPFGTYDVIIKGAKNLAVKLPSVALTTPNATLADALLPAGDANNDDIVDTTDFGVLVGVYGSDSNVTGSGYDASADFNFDGIVDTSDFGLLVGEYGNQGPL